MSKAQTFPASIRRPAAVDGKRVTIDEAALRWVGAEGGRLRDVIGSGEAGHRNTAGNVAVGVQAGVLSGVVHRSLDPSGTNGVAANAASSPLGGQSASQADEPVLGGVVGGAVGDSEQSGYRCNIDDAAGFLLEHDAAEGAAEE